MKLAGLVVIFAVVFAGGVGVGHWLGLPVWQTPDQQPHLPSAPTTAAEQPGDATQRSASAPARTTIVLRAGAVREFRQLEGLPSWEAGIRQRIEGITFTLNPDGVLIMDEPSGAPIFPARGRWFSVGRDVEIFVSKDARQNRAHYSVNITGRLYFSAPEPTATLSFVMGHSNSAMSRSSNYEATFALRR